MTKEVFVMPSNPDQLKQIADAVEEASNSKFRADSERSLQKEISKRLKEEFNMPPKMFNKMVKVYYKANFSQEVDAATEFEESYAKIMADKDPSLNVNN